MNLTLKFTLLNRPAFIFFLFSLHCCFAQHLPVKDYTVRDGLAQMQVISVFEDSRGYVWAATKLGLSKFDGERFENFYLRDGLASYAIHRLFEDSESNIWVEYHNLGLGKFDGQIFTNFIFSKERFSCATEHRGAVVLIKNDSLFRISKNKLVFTGVKAPSGANRLISDQVEEELYLNDDKGKVYWLDETTNRFIPLEAFSSRNQHLIRIGNHVLVSVNTDDVTEIYSLKKRSRQLRFSLKGEKLSLNADPGFSFVFSHQNRAWLYHSGERRVSPLSSDFMSGGDGAYQLAEHSHRVYFPSEQGLRCLFLNGFRYFTRQEVPYAWGVAEDRGGNIWISNYGSPLQRYDGRDLHTYRNYVSEIARVFKQMGGPSFTRPGGDDWYYHPLRDRHGKLWFPNISGALVRETDRSWKYIPRDTAMLSYFYLAEDPRRDRIIATGQGGFNLVDSRPPHRSVIIRDTAAMFQYPRWVLCAAVDSAGYYWFGGRAGVARYDPDIKVFKYYTRTNGKMPLESTVSLYFDSYGGLWAGSFMVNPEGLAKYDREADCFRPVFERYFADQPVAFMGQINERYFMAGDNINLYVIDLEALYKNGEERVVKVFNHHNGFMGIEPGQNGFFKASDGKIWICTGTELNVLDPTRLSFDPAPLRTFIRRINNRRLPFDYEHLPAVALEPGKNEVRIEVESVGEDKSAASEFSYRIPGFMNDWSEWQKDNAIYLTNMPTGKYRIEIRSKRGLVDADNHPATHLSFTVSLPLYRSPVFYKYALGIGGLLIGLIGVMAGRQYLQGRKLRKQTARAQDLNRRIKLLQVQSSQAQLNPHFIFNVLQTLQGQILNNHSEQAAENVVKLGHLIRGFLNASVSDENTPVSVLKLEIPLEEEIRLLTTYIDFEKEQKDNFDYKILLVPPLNPADLQVQPLLIQPFIENAIKHGFQDLGRRGRLLITFELEEEEVILCTVEDDGIGREAARRIREQSIRKYRSLGTEVVRRRIESLNQVGYDISVEVNDRPGGGTVVRIRMDFKESN